MNDMTPRRARGSLLERAADIYDFGSHLRPAQSAYAPAEIDEAPLPIRGAATEALDEPLVMEIEQIVTEAVPPAPDEPVMRSDGGVAIDRGLLAERGMIVPGSPIGALIEEFRQVKRQLLQTARIVAKTDAERSRTVLVCSAKPNDGKTFCAINLAISMAAERDVEVLLVDADFAKPDVMKRLGLKDGPGLLDALADPRIDVESCVIPTDIPQLSVLPAGAKSNTDTELLASKRTGEVLAELLAADPRRLVIFDSPPALAASPASVLASHAGQVMLVVRADRTSEGDLRDAVAQLDSCEHIQLVLNAVSFVPGGRRFGSYYDQEDAK